jgi:hypothetical protein
VRRWLDKGRTVEDKLGEQVSPEDFDAIGDGVTDDAIALIAWATCGVKNKQLNGKRYATSLPILFESGAIVKGCGKSSSIEALPTFSGDYIIGSIGTLSEISDLASSPSKYASALSFSLPHTLVPGDVGIIYNPTDYSWSNHRSNYHEGEFFKVLSIPTASSATLFNGLFSAYTNTNVNVYKINSSDIVMENFKVIGYGLTPCVFVSLSVYPTIKNVFCSGSDYAGIRIDKCYGATLDAESDVFTAGSDYRYGVIVSNSQHTKIKGAFYSTRHAISCGGDDET